MTGEEVAAGGGAGGGEGAPTSSCSPAPRPGTVPAPSHPAPPPSLSRPHPPTAPALARRRRSARPRAPLSSRPPTSPGARLLSEMPLQQQVSDPDRAGARANAAGTRDPRGARSRRVGDRAGFWSGNGGLGA